VRRKSRSIPWQRRPEATALLAELRNKNRGFDAVVIGEPHRAFYGNQYGLTFPLFEHYGVPLWVPEVGGPIDPTNEAHDLVMSVFGGMSKGERNRVKIRVRSAMAAQAEIEGRFLGGRPPYGYLLADIGPHPNPAKAADGKRLHALAPDPSTAPVVRRIFAEYLAGRGLKAIAEGLTRDDIPSPSAYDPGRNSHRCGIAWAYSAVRAILTNPRYTGRQVWNKQPKSELLIDVNDVALGHTTKQKRNEPDQWIWSKEPVHEPLIDAESFTQVQSTLCAKSSADERSPRRTPRGYALRGIMRCGICGRKMQGSWNNGKPHYRCVFLSQYGAKNKVKHPASVYLREEQLLPELDAWLARKLDPIAFTSAVRQYEATRPAEPKADDSAQQEIADCDAKLRQHRAALEAGADPVLVTSWMKETQARRALAEARLSQPAARERRRMTEDEITALVTEIGAIMEALKDADPADKAEVYGRLGLTLIYHPNEKRVAAEARPASIMYVGACPRGDLNPGTREISPIRGNFHNLSVTAAARRRQAFRVPAASSVLRRLSGAPRRSPPVTLCAAPGVGAGEISAVMRGRPLISMTVLTGP
jgi:DNA invertase Pin-like site-specific DNA recombinase